MANETGCILVKLELEVLSSGKSIPLPDVPVRLLNEDGTEKETKQTGTSGEACFSKLDEKGKYTVVVPQLLNEDDDDYPEIGFARWNDNDSYGNSSTRKQRKQMTPLVGDCGGERRQFNAVVIPSRTF